MSLDLDEARYNEPATAAAPAALAGPSFGAWTESRALGLSDGDYPISEPVIFKDGLFFAPLLVALQAIAPLVVTAGSLFALTQLYDVTFNSAFKGLAILAAALSLLFLQPSRNVVSRLVSAKLPLAVNLSMRWAIMLAVLLAIGYLTQYSEEFSRRVLATWAVATPGVLIGVTLLLQEAVKRMMVVPANARRVVFAGCNEMSFALAARLNRHQELCMSVGGFFDDRSRTRLGQYGRARMLGRLAELPEYVRRNCVDVIFIALPLRDVHRVQHLMEQLQDTTASIYYVPDIPTRAPTQARSCELLGMPVVALCETPFYGCRGVVKRLMDIVFSANLLLAFAPLMLLIALAVKWSSPGPVIFRQRRYGLNGQEISVFKFRTMMVTEDGEQVRQATKNDNRTTPVGRFLRRYSLDELPQLINVLQGRMSLVGPRPHAVAHNEEYRKLIRGYMVRHKMLPGMTGLAQINGCRGEISRLDDLQARVKYDLEYLRHWSPLLDLKILLLTIPQAFGNEKAY